MTGKQHAVMWLGLLLIITRMFTSNQWGSIWGMLSNKTQAKTNVTLASVKGGPASGTADWAGSSPSGSNGTGVQLT